MPTPKARDQLPSAAEFGLLRAYLAQAGVSQAQIKDVIGSSPNQRSCEEIAQLLKDWMKGLPKA